MSDRNLTQKQRQALIDYARLKVEEDRCKERVKQCAAAAAALANQHCLFDLVTPQQPVVLPVEDKHYVLMRRNGSAGGTLNAYEVEHL